MVIKKNINKMIKNYKNFIGESVENKGKGPGNNDLFPSTPFKQTLNRPNQTMDFLRVGKHILTSKIDGFIDSVQNENIFITDRLTGEIKKYTLKEVLREMTKAKPVEGKNTPVEGFTGTPRWAQKPTLVKEKIEAVHTILTPEDELDGEISEDEMNEYINKVNKRNDTRFKYTEEDEFGEHSDENFGLNTHHGMYRNEDYPQYTPSVGNDDDEELSGDTYNPGLLSDADVNSPIYDKVEIEENEIDERFRPSSLADDMAYKSGKEKLKKFGIDLDEEDEGEEGIDNFIFGKKPKRNRGTEDNPEGNTNPISESWNKYWETFDPLRERLEEEDYEDVMDINPDIFEEEKEEEEYEEPEGSEDNPIQMRKRLKIEDYSEDNPEPQYGDDRFDQFGFNENQE
jgi:hypothetical protein